MQFSHSRVECFTQCPHKFELRYKEGLKTLPNQEADNALYCGTAMHEGIEKGVAEGLENYKRNFYIEDDLQIHEQMKLEVLIPKVRKFISEQQDLKKVVFEYEINTADFKGFIDCLIPVGEHEWIMYDFKYSNHKDRYLLSDQLHLYKYYFERLNPYDKIVRVAYLMIPKTGIRQKKTETLTEYRRRLYETLNGMQLEEVNVPYDVNRVVDYLLQVKQVLEATEYPKHESRLCDFCEFKNYCLNGDETEIIMQLPSTNRIQINAVTRKKIWLYGAPFSGKTTLADQFPNALMLNTDGNLNSFTSARVPIVETFNGRQKVLAWENFNEVIDELQKGSEFETIVVDLVEDVYEACRIYCYKELKIEHESDNSFKAWDYIRNKFLTTMKRLMTLPYNIILISHEDMSKDITAKSGDKITSIRPNMPEKLANKLAGMVDIVGRVIGDDRTLNFKSDSVIFGGGRLKLNSTKIPLMYGALIDVYKQHQTAGIVTEGEGKQNVAPIEAKDEEIVRLEGEAMETEGDMWYPGGEMPEELPENVPPAPIPDEVPTTRRRKAR